MKKGGIVYRERFFDQSLGSIFAGGIVSRIREVFVYCGRSAMNFGDKDGNVIEPPIAGTENYF